MLVLVVGEGGLQTATRQAPFANDQEMRVDRPLSAGPLISLEKSCEALAQPGPLVHAMKSLASRTLRARFLFSSRCSNHKGRRINCPFVGRGDGG